MERITREEKVRLLNSFREYCYREFGDESPDTDNLHFLCLMESYATDSENIDHDLSVTMDAIELKIRYWLDDGTLLKEIQYDSPDELIFNNLFNVTFQDHYDSAMDILREVDGGEWS